MPQAVGLWRHYPNQIEADLALHYGRSIGEWHRGEMSSRELLVLLAGLPETSTFVTASQRSFRVIDYNGAIYLTPALGTLKPGAKLVAEYVDWTHDRKILARVARELAAGRADGNDYQPDFTGVQEPLRQILQDREAAAEDEFISKAREHVRSGLYGYERR